MKQKSWSWLDLAFFAMLVLAALSARMAIFEWITPTGQIEAEARHTFYSVDGILIRDVFRGISMQYQPGFDYLLRKLVFFPLIGYDERSVRLISLFFGLGSVTLCFLIIHSLLRRERNFPGLFVGISAFLGSIWLARASDHVFYSVMGRHYATTTFFSFLFAYAYFVGNRFDRRLHWCTGFFLNTHFFALVPTGLVYAWESYLKWRAREHLRRVLQPLIAFALIFGITVAINHKAFFGMLANQPSASFQISLTEVIAKAARRFLVFWTTDLGVSGFAFLPLVIFLALIVFRKRKPVAARLPVILLGPLLFLFLFALSKRSDYRLDTRYLYVFWGFIPVVFAEALLKLHPWFKELRARHKFKMPLFAEVFLAGVLVLFAFSAHAGGIFSDLRQVGQIQLPRKNFTNYFQGYAWAKKFADGRPLLVIMDTCYTYETAHYYIRYGYPGYKGALLVEDTVSCMGYDFRKSKQKIAKFLADNPRTVVLLDERRALNCPESVADAKRRGFTDAELLEHHFDLGNGCMQIIPRVKDLEDLVREMRKTGIHHVPGYFDGH